VLVTLEHDEAIAQLRQLAAAIDLRQAANAFVAALVASDLAGQTVLPAAALGLALPEHDAQWLSGGHCQICFYSPDAVDSAECAYFRRSQGADWGENNPVAGVLALQQAASGSPDGSWPPPPPRAIWVFYRLLDLVRGLPGTARYGKARSVIQKAQLLSANNRYRCETVLEALAFIGILETPAHPGMFTRFTPAIERDRRPNTRVEVPAPLAWWTAGQGLNEALVTRLFGHLECPGDEPPQPTRLHRRG